MKYLAYLSYTLIICLVVSCKEKEVLPSETQDGLDKFGVKINSTVWLPKESIGGGFSLEANYVQNTVGIFATKKSNEERIDLIITDVKSPGTYTLRSIEGSALGGGIGASKYFGNKVDDIYLPFPGGINEITITKLDTVSRIISGTFKVQLKGKGKGSTLDLTQGVFDVKYVN